MSGLRIHLELQQYPDEEGLDRVQKRIPGGCRNSRLEVHHGESHVLGPGRARDRFVTRGRCGHQRVSLDVGGQGSRLPGRQAAERTAHLQRVGKSDAFEFDVGLKRVRDERAEILRDVHALAVADVEQAHRVQRPDRFPHRRLADTELPRPLSVKLT